MLTSTQIEDAATALTCADPACQWCVDARAALAAYKRVVALLDKAEHAEMECEHGPPWVTFAELRRALEG